MQKGIKQIKMTWNAPFYDMFALVIYFPYVDVGKGDGYFVFSEIIEF